MSAAVGQFTKDGWRVASTQRDLTTLTRRSRNGIQDIFMFLITFGLWTIYIIYRLYRPVFDTLVLSVDDYGHVRIVSQNYGA